MKEPERAERDREAARWRRAREVFLELRDLPPEERGPRLERLASEDPGGELRAWVRRLLAQEERFAAPGAREEPTAGARIGPYAVLRRIAVGGMGEVLLARRADGEFERDVALKLLLPGVAGEEMLRRFQRERQTLARLDHEYVAKLYDGGTSADGRPYLVMELVEGRPIDAFCAEEDLDLDARLELFLKVGTAVEHAHQRGVIHRDLKPGNVLVRADGSPRLLDFGIARPTAERLGEAATLTATGGRLFTPRYASPEQVLGRAVDRRADVYALGVLLYELLTGTTPYAETTSLHELERAICEEDVAPPSRRTTTRRRARLSGDLDTIVLKCLAKDAGDRYPTVAALCEDIERHRAGLPIRARRAGPVRRAWKALRRHPWRFAAAGALLAALGASLVAWRSAEDRALRHAELRASARTLSDAVGAHRKTRSYSGGEAKLERLFAILDGLDEDDPLHLVARNEEVWLRGTQRGPQETAAAFEELLATEAPAAWETSEGRETRVLALIGLCNARMRVDGVAGALPPAEEALRLARRHAEDVGPLLVDALLGVAHCVLETDPERALSLRAEAVEAGRSMPKAEGNPVGWALRAYGDSLLRAGRHAEAAAAYREAIEHLEIPWGPRSKTVGELRRRLGLALERRGELAEARHELEEALRARTDDEAWRSETKAAFDRVSAALAGG